MRCIYNIYIYNTTRAQFQYQVFLGQAGSCAKRGSDKYRATDAWSMALGLGAGELLLTECIKFGC